MTIYQRDLTHIPATGINCLFVWSPRRKLELQAFPETTILAQPKLPFLSVFIVLHSASGSPSLQAMLNRIFQHVLSIHRE